MPKIKLEIVTAERLVLSEEVDFVSAPGIDGVLGILPRHAPLVTALTLGELRYKKADEEFHFAIGGGFMEVRPDKVTVLADSAEHAEEIDEMRAEQARERARELLKEKPRADVEFARIEQALRRAELRLRVAKRRRGTRRPPETGES
ncbi:MAG: F0F1 ATP synthase subunit epsilon [Chloroflexota bacterium]|nr:F0F1 ATP synthase subunit epsilon [Chloroflexota bacterium]